eukprot:scaffold324_cov239-Pinguiococcus_pyrenoidosus.AAC.2
MDQAQGVETAALGIRTGIRIGIPSTPREIGAQKHHGLLRVPSVDHSDGSGGRELGPVRRLSERSVSTCERGEPNARERTFAIQSRFSRRKESRVVPACRYAWQTTAALCRTELRSPDPFHSLRTGTADEDRRGSSLGRDGVACPDASRQPDPGRHRRRPYPLPPPLPQAHRPQPSSLLRFPRRGSRPAAASASPERQSHRLPSQGRPRKSGRRQAPPSPSRG